MENLHKHHTTTQLMLLNLLVPAFAFYHDKCVMTSHTFPLKHNTSTLVFGVDISVEKIPSPNYRVSVSKESVTQSFQGTVHMSEYELIPLVPVCAQAENSLDKNS